MGVIRLSVIALAGMGAALYYFGDAENVPDDPIGRETALLANVSLPDILRSATTQPAQEDSALTLALAADASPETPTLILASTRTDVAQDAAPTPAVDQRPSEPVATELTPEPEPVAVAMLYITGSRVNVRGGPSTNDGVISSLGYGTAVEDMGDAGGGWRAIKLIESGEVGYMADQFLSAEAP